MGSMKELYDTAYAVKHKSNEEDYKNNLLAQFRVRAENGCFYDTINQSQFEKYKKLLVADGFEVTPNNSHDPYAAAEYLVSWEMEDEISWEDRG